MENSTTQPIPQTGTPSNEAKTILSKNHNGWYAETVHLNLNGYDWKIRTSKSTSKGIDSHASGGSFQQEEHFRTFRFAMFQDPYIELASSDSRCTEKQVLAVHQKALQHFDHLRETNQLQSRTPNNFEIKVGQRIFDTDQSSEPIHIYEIKSEGHKHYKYVNLNTLQLGTADDLRHIDQKFGMGWYYRENDSIDINIVNNAVIDAKKLQAEESQQKAAEKLISEQITQEKINEGLPLVNIPSNAKGLISAHFKSDTSDPYTDYHGHTTKKTIYLAFSTHTKDLFAEMRKAALNAEETKFLYDAPKSFEHREKYSMGGGYYLGESRHSDWEIRKGRIDPTDRASIENLAIAAAEGRYFCQIQAPTETTESSETQNDLFNLRQTTHTKHGHDLFVAEFKDRVSRDTFYQLKNKAREFDGYYSSYRKDEAIPGFQFKTETARENFINSL